MKRNHCPLSNGIYNTFLGGSDYDNGYAIAVDTSGNVYVTGKSLATWGSPVHPYTGNGDAFVAKLNGSGALQWNTFLGGGGEYGYGIAVDGSGNVYVTGQSFATWGSPIRPFGGTWDAFVAKLNGSGALQWNTFLGSSLEDVGYGIAVDTSGNVYVTGVSNSTWGSPVRPHASPGYKDAFAAKLNGSGALQWNTFLGSSGTPLGSSGEDFGYGIAVDTSGNVYVTGYSPATWGSPVRPFASGTTDAFAAKLNGSGALQWNTFLGGGSSDYGQAIAVDTSGNVYMVGTSYMTWGSPVRPLNGSNSDAFTAKLDGSGALQWNTFLGGLIEDMGQAIAVDTSGNVYVAGRSRATWGSPVRPYTGNADAFAAKLNGSGTLQWNTFLGGSDFDEGYGIAVDTSGNVYVAGESCTTWGSPVRPFGGGYNDAFVAKISTNADISVSKTADNLTPRVGEAFNFTVTVNNNGPEAASGLKVTDLLPAGLSYVSSTASKGTYTSGTGIWDIGTLTNGGTVTLTIGVKGTSSGTVTNTASVSALNENDPNSSNDSASASVTLSQVKPPLSLTGEKLANRSLLMAEYVARLRWQANTANTGTITYRVYQVENGQATAIADIGAGTYEYIVRKLQKTKSYRFGVTAVNSLGWESDRVEVTVQ